jgi:hypothetical protein
VETAEQICGDLILAAKYIPRDQLGATDDCGAYNVSLIRDHRLILFMTTGFSPFSVDVKPRHGSPDFARDIAFQKVTNRIKGAKMASEKLHV